MSHINGHLVPLRRLAGDAGEMSDEALLAACATGDRAALGALFDRFHVAVYRFVAHLPAAAESARDDLVQATFLEVPRAAAHFRGSSTVKTWILGLAANMARHQVRGEHRRRVHQGRYAMADRPSPKQPDAQLERRRLLERITDALAALPDEQQVAFILCDLEQVSGVEAAKVLGVPEGTLWRRLHVARKAMRVALVEDPGE
jgi:RNA polymerase sigma-70 factor, ECF subfamily